MQDIVHAIHEHLVTLPSLGASSNSKSLSDEQNAPDENGTRASAQKNILPTFAGQREERFHATTIEIFLKPHDIDFEGIIDALATAKFLIIRQENGSVFNHGAPIDSEEEEAVARFMDSYVALSQVREVNMTNIFGLES